MNGVYADGLYQPVKPIAIPSLGGRCAMWFDVEEQSRPYFSPKQLSAWNEFCHIDAQKMRQWFAIGLCNMAHQIATSPKNDGMPSQNSDDMAADLQETAAYLEKKHTPLAAQSPLIFACDSLVVPVQDRTAVRFVVVNFQIAVGKNQLRPYGYELEALFCDGRLLFIAENSGLWTRLEWNDCFNVPDFDPHVVEV